MGGWVDAWVDGQMDGGWVDGQMCGWKVISPAKLPHGDGNYQHTFSWVKCRVLEVGLMQMLRILDSWGKASFCFVFYLKNDVPD